MATFLGLIRLTGGVWCMVAVCVCLAPSPPAHAQHSSRPQNVDVAGIAKVSDEPERRTPVANGDSAPPHFQALVWRSIGPAHIGGRISDIAAPTARPGEQPGVVLYAASSTGGLFVTRNAGAMWTPVFDGQSTSAINAVAASPSDPSVVWVGTGDPTPLFPATPGRGVFKSTDAGMTWQPVGLAASEYIGRIALDPTDANVAYVGAIGPLSRPSKERGVYKTVDGGRTWQQVLFVNEWTGTVDLAIDPLHPNIIFAALEQQAVRSGLSVDYGPGSGVYRSTDGGATWMRLTQGFPSTQLGRIGLTVCRSEPNHVYALVDASGEYRDARSASPKRVALYWSVDGGNHWTRGAAVAGVGTAPSYYGRLFCDPTTARRVYVGAIGWYVSEDGGRSVVPLFEEQRAKSQFLMPSEPGEDSISRRRSLARYAEPHSDQHALWIDPTDSNHLVAGNDGGVWITRDRGVSWQHMENMPLAQYRTVDADWGEPFYTVYGSMQDHSGYAGPSGSRHSYGITSADWFLTPAGESFGTAVDPEDSIAYVGETLSGVIRVDLRTAPMVGEGAYVGPSFADGIQQPWRVWNVAAPITVSAHDRRTLYTGTTRVWRSKDRGNHWAAVSGDLTHPGAHADTLMGLPALRDPPAHTISTLAESPRDAGILYAGTQDGLLYVSRDTAGHWTRLTNLPGVPPGAAVTCVAASRFASGVAYATFHAIENGDYRPYVFKTADYGVHWTSITANLPAGTAAWVIAEHFRTPGLLVLGTDVGVFATMDDGGHWESLRNNMPAVRVRDLVIQAKQNDLVVATYGRGVYILDDITPLEHLARAEHADTLSLFPVRDAFRVSYNQQDRDAVSNSRPYTAPNVPMGAVLSYFIPAHGVQPGVAMRVVDTTGAVQFTSAIDTTAGLHRLVWDLRSSAPYAGGPRGPLVVPGTYRVMLCGVHTQTVAFATAERSCPSAAFLVKPDPIAHLSPAVYGSIRSAQLFAGQLQAKLHVADSLAQQARQRVDSVIANTRTRSTAKQTASAVVAIAHDLARIEGEVGPITTLGYDSDAPYSLWYRVYLTARTVEMSVAAPPTSAQWTTLRDLDQEADAYARRLATILTVEWPRVRSALREAPIAQQGH